MSLLNPAALWGLLFLAVPILLLLLLNRRILILPWAAYAWMKEAVVKQKKQYELTDLLKLIAKLLLLFALSLFSSRPFVTTKGQNGNLIIVVDNSPSMAATLDQGTRLSKAKALAEEMVDRHEGRVALFSYGESLEAIVGKFSTDRAAIKDRLSRIPQSEGYGSAERMLSQIRALPIFPDTARIVVLGDFQSSWYGRGNTIPPLLDTFGPGFPMIWAQIDPRPLPDNVAITDISVTPEGAFQGRPLSMEIELLNGVSTATGDRVLTLWMDDRPIQRQTLRLEAGEKRRFPFSATFQTPGWHSIKAELDSDTLRTDNILYAAVNIPPSLNVLSITPSATRGGPPADLFIKAALRGVLPASHLNYRSISLLELDSVPLDGIHVVLLFGIPLDANSRLSSQMIAFAERGGSVVAFLPALHHDEANATQWRSKLAPTNTVTLEPRALKNTWADFMSAPGLRPEAITFKQAAVLTNIPPEQVRLTSTAGTLAGLRTIGRGKFAVVGFVPVPKQTSLPFNPNFVQLILRMMWDVRGWTPLYSDHGKVSEWQLPELKPDRTYTLTDGREINRPIPIEGLGKAARLLLPPDLPPGLYALHEDGVVSMMNGHNRSTGDSRLDPVTTKDLDAATRQGLTYTDSQSITKIKSRLDLGWLAFIFLLAALTLEAYAHFFRKRR